MTQETIQDLVIRYSADADLYLYSGDIRADTVDEGRELCEATKAHPTNATLILCTHGGDPHAAFRLIRAFQRSYKTVRLIINGPCKSAGTLIAIGADQLVMGPVGELGPLDVQMMKPNEIYRYGSGLDLPKALDMLTDSAYEHVKEYTARLTIELNLAAPVAAEVATRLVADLFKPISAQIDPVRLGEVHRATEIAQRYAKCLRQNNLKDDTAVPRLVNDYPSHGFVIDSDEAGKYFSNVEELAGLEFDIIKALGSFARYPSRERTVWNVTNIIRVLPQGDDATSDEGDANARE